MMNKTHLRTLCLMLLLCLVATNTLELKAQRERQTAVSETKAESITEILHTILQFSDSQYTEANKINAKSINMLEDVKNKYKNSERLSEMLAHEQQQIGKYRDQKLMRILTPTQKASFKTLQQADKQRWHNENATRYEKLIAEQKQLSPAQNPNNNQYKPLPNDKKATLIDAEMLQKVMLIYNF